jgi:DegV family protein with EDD domain
MNKVVILTDSTSDLTDEILKQKEIHVIPLHVNFGDKSYDDGVNITTAELYQKVEELGYLPKTSAASPGELIAFFNPWIEKDYDIVFLGIGGSLSATMQSAIVASSEFPDDRIYIVDSQNLSSGSGLLVLKAAKFRDQGLSAKEIASKLEEIVPKVRSQFAIATLEYLHR